MNWKLRQIHDQWGKWGAARRKSIWHLEYSLIKFPRRDLKGMVGAIIESPSPANSESHSSTFLKHRPHPVPAEILHGLIHQPIRVPTIHKKRLPFQIQLRPIPPHKRQLWLRKVESRITKPHVEDGRT